MDETSHAADTAALVPGWVRWRHALHREPELGFAEHRTARRVARLLGALGLQVVEGVGGTGVVGTLRVGTSARAIALRADMDALALSEDAPQRAYASRRAGCMHACGHDGHMAMLLGAAQLLAARRDFDGTVHFVFQPAEEHGRGGHAARPHMAVDALVVGAEIVLALQTLVSRAVDPAQPAVVSCTSLSSDGIRNALASRVVIDGDTRSFAPSVQALLQRRMRELCDGIARAHGARASVDYRHVFAPTINDAACAAAAVAAARRVSASVDADVAPMLISEDFGAMLQEVPGAFVFIGNGDAPDTAPLHNPRYDFNDAIVGVGARYFAELARLRLPRAAA